MKQRQSFHFIYFPKWRIIVPKCSYSDLPDQKKNEKTKCVRVIKRNKKNETQNYYDLSIIVLVVASSLVAAISEGMHNGNNMKGIILLITSLCECSD